MGEVAQEEEVAVGILFGAEDAPEHLPRRIVDRAVQHQARAAVLEPRMLTAVHLDEEARLRHALTATPMPGWAPFPGTAEAGLTQAALDGGPGEVEVLAFGEELGEMAIVTARVGGAGQGQQAGLEPRGEPTRGGTPPIPMGEGSEATPADRGQEAADVASGEAQHPRRVRSSKATMLDLREDMCPMLLRLGQGDHLPGHSPRVTESLSS